MTEGITRRYTIALHELPVAVKDESGIIGGKTMERRDFLKTALAAGAMLMLPRLASAAAVTVAEPFRWARIRGSYRWADHPTADSFLLETLKSQTSISVDSSWYVVDMDNLAEMVKFPVLFATSPDAFYCTDRQRQNLVEYVMRGGFILADDCVFKGYPPDKFTTSFKEMIRRAFDRPMVQIPLSDDVYHCFYDLPKVPVMQGKDTGGWGLYVNGRLAVFLDSGDIHCGWQSRYLRDHRMRYWFPRGNEELALKMGVNLLVYMMSH